MFAISSKLTQSLFWSSDKVKVLGARFCIFKLSDYQLRGGTQPSMGQTQQVFGEAWSHQPGRHGNIPRWYLPTSFLGNINWFVIWNQAPYDLQQDYARGAVKMVISPITIITWWFAMLNSCSVPSINLEIQLSCHFKLISTQKSN